nr:hypothetical protein [Mesorhizobium ciceri]
MPTESRRAIRDSQTDLPPFFRIVKPTLEYGFDHWAVTWGGKAAE